MILVNVELGNGKRLELNEERNGDISFSVRNYGKGSWQRWFLPSEVVFVCPRECRQILSDYIKIGKSVFVCPSDPSE